MHDNGAARMKTPPHFALLRWQRGATLFTFRTVASLSILLFEYCVFKNSHRSRLKYRLTFGLAFPARSVTKISVESHVDKCMVINEKKWYCVNQKKGTKTFRTQHGFVNRHTKELSVECKLVVIIEGNACAHLIP